MCSSISTPRKYDVFLSFSYEDVGDNFVSHLYSALCVKKLKIYRPDPDDTVTEDEVSSVIMKAVDDSRLLVVIFSQKYVSSSRCLNELLHIMEWKGKGKLVVPVFYHVRPSNLLEAIVHKVDARRRALEEASRLSGWSSSDFRLESKLVEEIVEDILKKLNRISSNHNSDFLVGIDERIEKIESLLRIGSPDAIRIVGILGQGGTGKTTLAHVVYNKVSSQFESCYFLSNVKDELNRHGLIELQNKLLAGLLGTTNQDLSNPSFGLNFSRAKLRRKKVLLVLDDVDNSYQFKLLASEKYLFGHGSRMIVTTRDLQVLNNIGTDIYRVEELNYQEALQLFYSTCFRKIPPTKNYRELSKEVVDYANGNPLALKILGSNLFNRDVEAWEDMLTKLKKAPNVKVPKMLKICYDALDSIQKDVFLDIACFFRGEKRDHVEEILDCASSTSISDAIDDLIAKSLITLGHSNELQMHDLVQEMGREIVQQESVMQPEKRSRLWLAEDVCKVLQDNAGTAEIKGISLDMSQIEEEALQFNPTTFKKMTNLRLLKIYYSSTGTLKIARIPRDFRFLPNTLRYLHWDSYPLPSLPPNFAPQNLVELHMPCSQLEQLWDGVQNLKKLKKIDLHHSSNLTQLPDLSRASNLESLYLQECASLSEIPSYFQSFKELTCLDLNGCASLYKLPELPLNMKELYLSGTNIESLPSSIGCLSNLERLFLRNCKRLDSLPPSISKLKNLKLLNMSGCSKLEYFPEILDPMEHLWFLSLNGTRIKGLPSSIKNLIGLQALDLRSCENLEFVPENIYCLSKLETLSVSDCVNLHALPGPGQSDRLPCLSQLNLSNCRISEVPDLLDIFFSLESLDLSGNENIEGIPTSIKQLTKLKHLDVSNCKMLQSLPEIPLSLELVDAHGCTSLKTVSSSKTALTRGWDHLDAYSEKLVFFNCSNLNQKARSNLIADFQLRILRMATVSRNKSEHVLEFPSVSICYPGNQIPKWFSYQTAGSSISIKLPPHWRNTNFLGFALCVVAEPLENYSFHPEIHFCCKSSFLSKDGQTYILNKCFLTGYIQAIKFQNSNDNHVFMWSDYGLYHHGQDDMSFTSTEVSFEFFPTDSLEQNVNSYEVKRCGIHMLYLQEAAKFDFIDPYPVRESKGKEIGAPWNDTEDPSECGSIGKAEEEEEDAILSESEPSPDGDVDSDIMEGDGDTHLEGIYQKESRSCGCLQFLSKIEEFFEYVLLGKKSGHDKGSFGFGLRREFSTSSGTSFRPRVDEKHLQELEKTLKILQSEIKEMQNLNKYLECMKKMERRPLPGLEQK